jgi:hypothetical protein
MRIYATTPPAIYVGLWLRRYATALIVVALVGLVTLGVGVAQTLYSNARPRTIVLEASVKSNTVLDQHERHAPARAVVHQMP